MADTGPHTCPMCEETFENEETLREHGKQEHQDHDPEEDETGPEGTGL